MTDHVIRNNWPALCVGVVVCTAAALAVRDERARRAAEAEREKWVQCAEAEERVDAALMGIVMNEDGDPARVEAARLRSVDAAGVAREACPATEQGFLTRVEQDLLRVDERAISGDSMEFFARRSRNAAFLSTAARH